MLLKEMKLRDFRQFKGEQKIAFSTDPIKNVTIIMGENGAGKTTLAQAFTWCLYGDTDFDDKNVVNISKIQEVGPNQEVVVRVELSINHSKKDYIMIREQKYLTDSVGGLKRPFNTHFNIAYKGADGQLEFVKEAGTEILMQEILPRELAKYFFFDGERIGNMSKEIRKGKSKEFAEAVKGLLGLNSFLAAMSHLNGKMSNTYSVVKSYEKDYDSRSDVKISEYTKEKDKYEERLQEIECRLTEIDNEQLAASDKAREYEQRISENKDSEIYANQRISLNNRLSGLQASKVRNTAEIIQLFNKKGSYWMAQKMVNDSLEELALADKIDTGIPDIHARTIQYLFKRGTCICGQPIEFGHEAHKELMKLLDYIPPQSVGTIIGQFVRECELKAKGVDGTFEDLGFKYSVVRNFENDYNDIAKQIETINKKLEGMLNVGELQKKYTFYNSELKKLAREHDSLIEEKVKTQTNKDRVDTSVNELILKDENNKRIARFKAYASYMYQYIENIYKDAERETREKLEKTVNEIFKQIYNGGFSLSIDEKYNIQVIVDDLDGYSGDVETSTAQSISVIFAFIAGVIKLARENESDENSMLVTEVYPLVMDAPLSSFDKARIKTVCDALPKVAEQVIIFIKDTDGEIAEENMSDKVGTRYSFAKENEFVTTLTRR